MRGAELAIRLVLGSQQAAQLGPGRQHDALRHPAQRRFRTHLHHRHRGRRAEIMRIDHLQQRLREGREFRFQLELDARGQQREAFQQPFHIRVGNVEAGQIEPRGDLGKFARRTPGRPRARRSARIRKAASGAGPSAAHLSLGYHREPCLQLDRAFQEQLLAAPAAPTIRPGSRTRSMASACPHRIRAAAPAACRDGCAARTRGSPRRCRLPSHSAGSTN